MKEFNCPRHQSCGDVNYLTAIHSLLVWHWNWNLPHDDFVVEVVLVLVTSANLAPSGGTVEVVEGITSGDLQSDMKWTSWREREAYEEALSCQAKHVPPPTLTADMHSMDVSNWLILIHSARASAWQPLLVEWSVHLGRVAAPWELRSCSLCATWICTWSRRADRSGRGNTNRCSEMGGKQMTVDKSRKKDSRLTWRNFSFLQLRICER